MGDGTIIRRASHAGRILVHQLARKSHAKLDARFAYLASPRTRRDLRDADMDLVDRGGRRTVVIKRLLGEQEAA